jgi:Zn-dependent alcohol dehydrogenase
MAPKLDLTTSGIVFNQPTGPDSSYKCESITFQRHAPGDEDIAFDLKYCGVCHSDVHATESKGGEFKPVTPGHELAGIVTHVGSKVKNFKVGDKIGVGCMVDSCQEWYVLCSNPTNRNCRSLADAVICNCLCLTVNSARLAMSSTVRRAAHSHTAVSQSTAAQALRRPVVATHHSML